MKYIKKLLNILIFNFLLDFYSINFWILHVLLYELIAELIVQNCVLRKEITDLIALK